MRVAGQGSSHDRLLKAGKTLFARHGYEATTTAAIAKAAHTSQSQLIKHFKDKHGILAAAIEAAWQHINPAIALAVARISKPAERFRLVLNMVLSAVEKDASIGAVLALDGGAVRQPDGKPFISPGYQQFAAIIDRIVEAMRLNGELRADVHPRALRAVLMGSLEKFVRDTAIAATSGSRYPESALQIVIFRLLAGCSATKAAEEVAAAHAAAVPLEIAAPEDDAWIRQYTGLAEALLKIPPAEA